MKKILAVAVKEMRQISRDPLSLIMLLGIPAFMLVVFGYAVNFDVEGLALVVQNRDPGAASRQLLDTFFQSRRFALAGSLPVDGDAEEVLATDRARGVLVIPERFGEDLAAGRTARVQLLMDGSDSNTATTALGYAQGAIAAVNAGLIRSALRKAGALVVLDAGIAYRPRVWYNPELKSSVFLVPGLVGFILMVTAVLSTALSVVREIERGTMEQLRVAPLRTPQVLLGKMGPYLGISLTATALILGAARLLFQVEVRGSYVALLGATVLYLIGSFGFGLLISTIASSQAMAFQLGVFASLLPSIFLSGFVFPIHNMPGWLQVISHVVPARYYITILRGIMLKGTGLGPYWDQMGALAIYTVVVMGLASARFARQGG